MIQKIVPQPQSIYSPNQNSTPKEIQIAEKARKTLIKTNRLFPKKQNSPNQIVIDGEPQEWKQIIIKSKESQNVANQINSTEIVQKQQVIFERTGHCCFIYKNNLHFYGGYEQKNNQDNAMDNLNTNTEVNSNKQTMWNSFHILNLETNQTQIKTLSMANHSNLLQNVSSFGHLIIGNMLYILGGINWQTGVKKNIQMVSINIDSGNVKKYQSKTSLASIPSHRLYPLIASIQKSVLMVMGGIALTPGIGASPYLNDMYTFKIQTKTWTKIQDTFHSRYPLLVRPYLVSFGDNCIFLLGGKRQILDNDGSNSKLINNHHIYKLKIVTKTVNSKPDCLVRQLICTNPIPQSQSIIFVGKHADLKGVIAITRDIQLQNKVHVWYFDNVTVGWVQLNLQNKFINFDADFSVSGDIILAKLRNNKFYKIDCGYSYVDQAKYALNNMKHTLCSLCKDQNQISSILKNQIPAAYLQQFCGPSDFPFAAIGLLVDNTVVSGAKNINLFFDVDCLSKDSTQKIKYMFVQDNGSPSTFWNSEMKPMEFVTTISKFYATAISEDIMAEEDNQQTIVRSLKELDQKEKGLQKEFSQFLKSQNKTIGNVNQPNFTLPSFHFKNQKDFEKQQHEYIEKRHKLEHKKKTFETNQKCKQFCNNLKMATIKLGDTVIYACKQKKGQQGVDTTLQKQIRRYFFMKKQKDNVTNNQFYACFAYVTENGNTCDPRMQSTIKYANKQFKKQLKLVTDRLKTQNSVVLIKNLKGIVQKIEGKQTQQTQSYELRLKRKQNDVYYGESALLNSLQSQSTSKIDNCIDISLRAYLSMLYLNKQQPQMYISVKENQLQFINSQPFLPAIDKLIQNKRITQISKCFDFADECSVVQIYWSTDRSSQLQTLINNLGFQVNGVLIYQKGRLISRYLIQMGRLNDNLHQFDKSGFMFGYLQIKPHYRSNMYTTDLLYPRTLQKYFSRMKFVQKFMQQKYQQKRVRARVTDDKNMKGPNKYVRYS